MACDQKILPEKQHTQGTQIYVAGRWQLITYPDLLELCSHRAQKTAADFKSKHDIQTILPSDLTMKPK